MQIALPITLKGRLGLGILLLTFASAWTLALIMANQQEEHLKNALAAQQHAIARLIANDINQHVQERWESLEEAATQFPLVASTPDAVAPYLRRFAALYTLFDAGIVIVKPDGRTLWVDDLHNPRTLEATPDQQVFYQEALRTGQPTIGMRTISTQYKVPAVAMILPVQGLNGDVIALLVGYTSVMNKDFLNCAKLAFQQQASGTCLVIAPALNVFLIGPDPSFMLKPLPAHGVNRQHDKYMAGHDGSGIAVSSQGAEELSSAHHVTNTGWFVVIRLPTAEAFASIQQLREQALIGATLFALCTALCAVSMVRWSLRPLDRAIAKLNAMTQGKSPLSPICVVRRDEIGNLLTDFNALLAKIQSDESRLQREYQLAQEIVDALPGLFYLFDESGRFIRWNRNMETVSGCTADQLSVLHPLDLFGLQDRERVAASIAAVFQQGSAHVEAFLVSRTGQQVPFYFTGYRISLDGVPHLIGTGIDLTERHRAEEKLQLAACVFHHTHDGILITDQRRRIVDSNPVMTELMGYTQAELLGNTPRLFHSGKHDATFYADLWEAIEKDAFWRGEIWNRRKDGQICVGWNTISAVRNAQQEVTHYVAIFSDIGAMKAQQEQIERMAHYDALTQLPNRVLLHDRLLQSLAQVRRNQRQMAVVFLDLDGFKPINDRLGHEAGDCVLIEVARRLTTCLRAGDTVARLGGDEFVLLLVGFTEMWEAHEVLLRVLATVSEPMTVVGETVAVSTSIGVAVYPRDGADTETLLRHADQAMYEAKRGGRNQYRAFNGGAPSD